MCANLYAHFHYELGDNSYHPPGSEKLSDDRLFGMFHANNPQHNKDVILCSLAKSDGVVRVVFATVALGMGINLRDVNTIIHYGAPHSIEDYFQESGRGGRSGEQARSVVYWKPVDCKMPKKVLSLRDKEVAAVRDYLGNESLCRRQLLLQYFDPSLVSTLNDPLICCDVCAGKSVTQVKFRPDITGVCKYVHIIYMCYPHYLLCRTLGELSFWCSIMFRYRYTKLLRK